jgi:hypothetical protein
MMTPGRDPCRGGEFRRDPCNNVQIEGTYECAGAPSCARIARDWELRHPFGRERSQGAGSPQKAEDAQEAARRVEAGAAPARHSGELNEPQRRRLSVTCEYVDRLLQDVEQILASGSSKSPFPRYVLDVSGAQNEALEGYIGELRAALLRALAWQQMQPREADIPASRAVLINLDYVGIAIEELKPRYMRGSGAVPDDAVDGLNRVVDDLRAAADSMERYLQKELGSVPDQAGPNEGGGKTPPRP